MIKHNFKVGDWVIFTGESYILDKNVVYEVHSIRVSSIGVVDRFGGVIYRNKDDFKPYSYTIGVDNNFETLKDCSCDIDNKIKILEAQLKTLKDAKLILKGE